MKNVKNVLAERNTPAGDLQEMMSRKHNQSSASKLANSVSKDRFLWGRLLRDSLPLPTKTDPPSKSGKSSHKGEAREYNRAQTGKGPINQAIPRSKGKGKGGKSAQLHLHDAGEDAREVVGTATNLWHEETRHEVRQRQSTKGSKAPKGSEKGRSKGQNRNSNERIPSTFASKSAFANYEPARPVRGQLMNSKAQADAHGFSRTLFGLQQIPYGDRRPLGDTPAGQIDGTYFDMHLTICQMRRLSPRELFEIITEGARLLAYYSFRLPPCAY